MIRPFTLVCMASAFGAGLYLYQCKHQAQLLDREIQHTVKQTETARERTGMLRAEWALLNEPERLAELARAHTGLQTLKPTQFVALSDLATRLPAPVAPGQPAHPAEPEAEDAVPVAQATPTQATPKPATLAPDSPVAAAKPHDVASAAPEPKPDPKPVSIAEAKPAAPRHAAKPLPSQPETVAPVQVATAPPHRVARYAPSAAVAVNNDAVAPGTVGAAVMRAMRAQREAPAYVQPAASTYAPRAFPQPAYASPAYMAPATSVLGGSRALPPPVPFAAR